MLANPRTNIGLSKPKDPATIMLAQTISRKITHLASHLRHSSASANRTAVNPSAAIAAKTLQSMNMQLESSIAVLGAKNARKVSVPAEPLSTKLRNRGISQIDFLKVDVEGAEYDILLGDSLLWDQKIRSLIVEADRAPRDARYSIKELVEFLNSKFRSVSVGSGDYPLITCLN